MPAPQSVYVVAQMGGVMTADEPAKCCPPLYVLMDALTPSNSCCASLPMHALHICFLPQMPVLFLHLHLVQQLSTSAGANKAGVLPWYWYVRLGYHPGLMVSKVENIEYWTLKHNHTMSLSKYTHLFPRICKRDEPLAGRRLSSALLPQLKHTPLPNLMWYYCLSCVVPIV
jgi:hypothetical protein